jgi:hypothetical protein
MEHIKIYEEFLGELNESTVSDKGGGDFDHFGKIIKPNLSAVGFKWVPVKPVHRKPGYADGYYCFPDHTGVNLFLDKPLTGPWKYVVYNEGQENTTAKEFGWPKGTEAEVKKAANAAVDYAIFLKNDAFDDEFNTYG